MKISTLNCAGLPFSNKKKRFDVIAEQIRGEASNIVCLQEVISKKDPDRLAGNGYSVHTVPGILVNKGGLAILSKGTVLEDIRFERFKDQGKLNSRQIADCILGKGFMTARVPKLDARLVNAHMVSSYSPEFTPCLHLRAQIEQLLDHIESDERVILCGDLNTHKDSPYYDLILDDGFVDLRADQNEPTYMEYEKTLDYIFIKGQELASQFRAELMKHLPTDHRGVVALMEAE